MRRNTTRARPLPASPWSWLSLAAFVAACGGVSGTTGKAERRTGTTAATPAAPVDSILPIEEEIRRFREKVPETPNRLTGGAGSRDALVRRWVLAVETRDSATLAKMVLDAAEYITFYYPESPYTRPPYRQGPGVRWALITAASAQGAERVWQRHAGRSLGFTGYRCDPNPERMGRNLIWTGCLLEWANGTGRGANRLFGPIIERDGEFKFLTYASDY